MPHGNRDEINPGASPHGLPVTAIVASRNEAALLRSCLPSIRFCDELLVVDLDSSDDTVAVAEAHGAMVLRRPPEPSIERIRAGVAGRARNDWLLFTDPDEEVPGGLAAEIGELLAAVQPDIALVYAPIQYYFGNRALRGTVWGGPRHRRFLVRRSGAEVAPAIYAGVRVLPGYRSIELAFTPETAIVHHWMTGYREFVAKHQRYVRVAADDRARGGETTGYRAIAWQPWASFYDCYMTKGGYRDGLTGFMLSLFWAWFATSSEIALKRRLRDAPQTEPG